MSLRLRAISTINQNGFSEVMSDGFGQPTSTAMWYNPSIAHYNDTFLIRAIHRVDQAADGVLRQAARKAAKRLKQSLKLSQKGKKASLKAPTHAPTIKRGCRACR
jgi:hypothetical protein